MCGLRQLTPRQPEKSDTKDKESSGQNPEKDGRFLESPRPAVITQNLPQLLPLTHRRPCLPWLEVEGRFDGDDAHTLIIAFDPPVPIQVAV